MSVCLVACLSIRLSARIARKLHGLTSPNFSPHVDCGRGSFPFGSSVICCVLPVCGWRRVFTQSALLRVMCIPKRRQRNRLNYCIDSKQFLLNDKDQQVHVPWEAHREQSLLYTVAGRYNRCVGILVACCRLQTNRGGHRLPQWAVAGDDNNDDCDFVCLSVCFYLSSL